MLIWHHAVLFVLKIDSDFSMLNHGLKHIVMKTLICFLVSNKKAVLFTRGKVFFLTMAVSFMPSASVCVLKIV